MERKIGERFEYNGDTFEVIKEESGCDGCDFSNGDCTCPTSIRGSCTIGHRKDRKAVIFKKVNDVEQKLIKIQVPEGYEIDKENSTFEEIKFKLKKITYRDVAKELFYGKQTWRGNDGSIIEYYTYNCFDRIDNATSKRQIEKLFAINQLLNVAKYLNKDWKPDWYDPMEEKYYFRIANDYLIHDTTYTYNFCPVYFQTEELLFRAKAILGEETIKLALSTDY